ncbi:threonine--tRNA ligase [Alloiococcus sp. CFN-8]|uniref:threonine--tRNA ligase n=1 Tax=Alloiococcus sp. CFN-8 TaxID=3416081 RepID=UPI003CEDF0AB
MIKITLKDGSQKEYPNPISIIDLAADLSEGLARVACVGMVNGEIKDLRYVISEDSDVNILTFQDEEGKKAFRHTASHILALAVKRLFPDTKLAIGPAIDDGFYYDFDREGSFTYEDLEKLEGEMKKIVKEDLKLERFELPRAEAIKLMEGINEPYKVELINDLPEDAVISFYKMGEFTDLCAGPHLMSTKYVKAFKLTHTAGAYWRGSEKNKMLSRIYGTAYTKKADLDAHLERLEEAKKRDHNRLGREMGYFTTSEIIGQGLPLLTGKGSKVLQILQRFVEDEEESRGYIITKTPFMAKSDLYKISGHWSHYKDGMFVLGDEASDDEIFALRPMTCPFQFAIYNSEQHSYRELPIKYAETSTLFRNEASGEMHGLIRVRQFTLADGHIICTPEQVEEEFKEAVDLIKYVMKAIGIHNDITYRFSKWDPSNPDKYIDNPAAWESAERKMKTILDHLDIAYKEAIGEAAFYGPKLDVQFKNVHGKEDTIITIQLDFALAERFNMTYVDKDGEKKRPFIIHRSSIGCYERTLAMLIEKYAGALPTWMAPVQAKILPISEKYHDYCAKVAKDMKRRGIRVEVDYRAEKIGYKIRQGRMEKHPYLLIIGEKEVENNEVAVRSRKNGDEGAVSLDSFIERITSEIDSLATE